MKKFLKNIKSISLCAVLVFVAVGYFPKIVSAGYSYQDIPYIVAAGNIPPVADAGVDRTTASGVPVTIPVGGATATDADGTITSIAWTQVSGSSAGIANGTTLTPTFSGMNTLGNYTFRLTVIDNNGATDFDDMVVTVSAPSNLPPVSVPGPNQSIAQPSSSVSVDGSGSYDPDGTITAYQWQQNMVGAPAVATIVSPSSAATSITGMTVLGTYRFALTVTDNIGATNSASMTVVVNASGSSISVTLTATPNILPAGGGTTGLTWTSTNATSCTGTNFNTGGATHNAIGVLASLTTTTTYRIDCTNGLASAYDEEIVTVMTKSTPLDGVCAPTHFQCSAGTSINNTTGATSWTWTCQGINGGLDASCSENFPTGRPQCSDEADNDGDALIDINDPGCHTDGKASNPATYDPNDNDERNAPKIKVIEI